MPGLPPNVPQYANTRFGSRHQFEHWLEQTTKYVVTFEDAGDEFRVWNLDSRGEILHSDRQSVEWSGRMVDVEFLLSEKKVAFIDTNRFLKRKILNIETRQEIVPVQLNTLVQY